MFGENPPPGLFGVYPVLTGAALVCAILAAVILIWYLVKKPELNGTTKVLLFFGFGAFPIGAALTGNLAGFQQTTQRDFCGSCHVMTPYEANAEELTSTSLAAIHSRNETFGTSSCYECHSDYGMFGTVMTKWGGMLHVWHYYTDYHDDTLEEALPRLELYKPFPNIQCMRCHSTEIPGFVEVPDHRTGLERIRSGQLSCMGSGCHGPAHPVGPDADKETLTEAIERTRPPDAGAPDVGAADAGVSEGEEESP